MTGKIPNILISLLLSTAVYAEAVPRELALQKASEFLGCSTLSLARTGASVNGTPSYYIFNNPEGGWVMISGDDSIIPVLGYSEESCFPENRELPRNISCRFGMYEKLIRNNRVSGIRGDRRIRGMWEAPLDRTKAGSKVLITTAEWDQGSPYNASCPKISGESSKAVTGCVATALAITMRNNVKEPLYCSGTLESYSVGRTTIPAVNLNGKVFDMSQFSLKGMQYWTSDTYKKSLQDLMYYLGVSVHMAYSSKGSSSYEDDVLPAVTVHFSISDDAILAHHYNYSDYDWFKKICRELDEGLVIPYFGADEQAEEGHAFVCDGYNEANMVHINWGWSGECNGWFAITKLGPVQGDIFSDYDDAIFGLRVGNGGKKVSNELYLWGGEADSDYFYGISLKSGKIERNSDFKLNAGYICNDELWPYEGKFRIALLNADGEVREAISKEIDLSVEECESFDGYLYPGCALISDIPCRITAQPDFGDVIAGQYTLPNGTWANLACDKLEDGTTACLGVTEFCAMKTEEEYSEGDVLYFDILNGQKNIRTSVWYLDGKRQSESYTILKAGQHKLKVEIEFTDDSRETIEQTIKVQQ